MTALRKFAVFLPQVIGVALSVAGGTVAITVGGALFMPAAVVAGVAGAVSFFTTLNKAINIIDGGWGLYDAALATSCASCRGYRLNNDRLKREVAESREALATLRLP